MTTGPPLGIYVKQDSSATEFTKYQSLVASTVNTSPGDSSVSTGSVKSRTSNQPLEKRAGDQAACVQCKVKLYAGCAEYMEQDPNGRK
jgi:Ni,Fe-hydrogenase I large subunit